MTMTLDYYKKWKILNSLSKYYKLYRIINWILFPLKTLIRKRINLEWDKSVISRIRNHECQINTRRRMASPSGEDIMLWDHNVYFGESENNEYKSTPLNSNLFKILCISSYAR